MAGTRDRVRRKAGSGSSPAAEPGRASLVVQRRVEWSDTDAAGHHHFTAVLRWLEEAETLLYERLGASAETSGRVPRVHLEVDFLARLWFRDIVEVEVTVARVGTSSVTYDFEVRSAAGVAARGSCVAVQSGPGTSGSQPWPEKVRRALSTAGAQPPELLVAGVTGLELPSYEREGPGR